MGEYTVYMHEFPNGKKYVGITSQDVSRRWRDGEGYEGQAVYGAILKYGWNNVKHEVLFEGLTKEQAEEEEKALIKRYGTTGHANGYDVELGGNATGKVSDETPRKKRARFSGKGNPMYGTEMSAEHKKKPQVACVKAKSRPVVCVETGKVYQSAAQAQRETGICPRTIGYVVNHDRRYKTAGGYHWKYKEVA